MKKIALIIVLSIFTINAYSQGFETPQNDGDGFESVDVKIGADFALQFQGLNHHADSMLIPLGKGINLPTANMRINAELAPGIEVNLSTYLSSRHHVEAWVKGGYLSIDELAFFNSSVIDKLMDKLTIKAGVMEINYGDAHFRRSDNGYAINNPFVGNYVMDAFTTAPAFEVMFRQNGFLVMAGVNTGTLKPSLTGYSSFSGYTEYKVVEELAYYGKLGFDKELFPEFRLRLMGSIYLNEKHHFGSLYYGDRTGSRYYLIMNKQTFSSDDVDPAKNHLSGRWSPGFTNQNNAYMINLFAEYKGIEIFGTYEHANGTAAFTGSEFQFNQLAVEGLYHFGGTDQFFAGARYNNVKNDSEMSIVRLQGILGWDMTENIRLKLEYVSQSYDGFDMYGQDAGFEGFMFEGAISF